MPLLLDKRLQSPPANFSTESTVGDFLKWAQTLLPEGRIVVKILRDDQLLEGRELAHARRDSLGKSTLSLTTADRQELSLTMLGKLAALIEWLTPQHKQVAEMLERGQTQKGLERLSEILSAWQQIQSAYGNLAKMLVLALNELPVHDLTGQAVLEEFCRQLAEIQTALQNQDFVLLADILQYEMEGAVANWLALLEATLGVVDPTAATQTK